jgi:hypothetical protein
MDPLCFEYLCNGVMKRHVRTGSFTNDSTIGYNTTWPSSHARRSLQVKDNFTLERITHTRVKNQGKKTEKRLSKEMDAVTGAEAYNIY